MNLKYFCPQIAAVFLVLGVFWGLFLPAGVSAEVIELKNVEGRYPGGMKETPEEMKLQALEQAKRAAAEQAGSYLESHTEVDKGIVTKDKIRSMAAVVMSTTVREERFELLADGKTFEAVCVIDAKVDTDRLNIKDLLAKEDQLRRISDQDRRIKELEAEAERLRRENRSLTTAAEKQKVADEFAANRRKSLIAIYEKNLDVFDLGQNLKLTELMETADKLSALDPQNPLAFRATVYVYRDQQNMGQVVNYCENVLAKNPPPELRLEAYAQLGDIYLSEYDDPKTAKKFIDQGIALVKQKYSRSEIEKLVNDTGLEVSDLMMSGKTNTVQQLYIMKSEVENVNPVFEGTTVIEDMMLVSDKIQDITYRTDW